MLEAVFDEIIITSVVRYGESDAIARVFSREHGRLSLFSRGGFKPSKRRGSMLQAPARARAGFKLKEQSLSVLSELDIGQYTVQLSRTLRSFALASYACEICEVFVAEHDPSPYVFDLLDDFLRLASAQDIETHMIREFEFGLLDLCGLLGAEEALEEDLMKRANIFARHLAVHKQNPLKSLAFFKQIGTSAT
jgi:DNA repair protein RecO